MDDREYVREEQRFREDYRARDDQRSYDDRARYREEVTEVRVVDERPRSAHTRRAHHAQENELLDHDVGSVPPSRQQREQERNAAREKLQSQAVSAWLGDTKSVCPEISPVELVEWVRSLPSSKLPEESKKMIARKLLNDQVNGTTFTEICNEGGERWLTIGVTDKSQQASLTRLFKQKKHEALMAQAACDEHIAQRAFVNNKKAEMFNA